MPLLHIARCDQCGAEADMPPVPNVPQHVLPGGWYLLQGAALCSLPCVAAWAAARSAP
jgi:hypothetical protein